MRMSEGVEWGVHCCLLLDWLGPEAVVPSVRLAAAFEIPPAYLNKQLQALTRAGILDSTRGAGGGFSLARGLDRITMLDVVDAIEGTGPAFRCTEIRRCGLGAGTPRSAFKAPCSVAAAMHEAEAGWRGTLRAKTLAEVQAAAERSDATLRDGIRSRFAEL